MLFSHAGMVMEMYDHTNFEENRYGFTGFLSGGAASYGPEVRREFVLNQLSELFEPQAARPSTYVDKVWTDGFLITGSPAFARPHQANGHPLLHEAYLDGRLLFCGTETASAFPGYMEGAIGAAKRVAAQL